MKGFVSAEQGHWVQLLPAIDETGGKTTACFSMSKYQHASIFIGIGVSAAAPGAITVEQCTSAGGANNVAIPFNIYKGETTAVDTLGARTNISAAGYTPPATDNIFYVIELDASELADGSTYVRVVDANGTNSVIASVSVLLTGARYAHTLSATAIT
jgi:hypothetical protein